MTFSLSLFQVGGEKNRHEPHALVTSAQISLMSNKHRSIMIITAIKNQFTRAESELEKNSDQFVVERISNLRSQSIVLQSSSNRFWCKWCEVPKWHFLSNQHRFVLTCICYFSTEIAANGVASFGSLLAY